MKVSLEWFMRKLREDFWELVAIGAYTFWSLCIHVVPDPNWDLVEIFYWAGVVLVIDSSS
jgi:hypothetical protein